MSIDSIVAAYIETRAARLQAEKQEKQLQQLIIAHAAGSGYFSTDNYNVLIVKRTREYFDTAAFYSDFPDGKKLYSKLSSYDIIQATEKEQASAKSA